MSLILKKLYLFLFVDVCSILVLFVECALILIILNFLILNLNLMSKFPGSHRAENIDESDSSRIEKSVDSKESKIYASQKLAKFFELEVTLKVFGKVIWTWVFPPKN